MQGYMKFNLASQSDKPNIRYQGDWVGVDRIHRRTHTDPLNFNAKGVGGKMVYPKHKSPLKRLYGANRDMKYKNKKITHNGITFDSKKECERYQYLKALERAGAIGGLTTQKVFVLVPSVKLHGEQRAKPAIKYKADFCYVINKTGEQMVEDVKSPATKKDKVYRIKKHLMKAVHGIDVVEV